MAMRVTGSQKRATKTSKKELKQKVVVCMCVCVRCSVQMTQLTFQRPTRTLSFAGIAATSYAEVFH
jgi:hypothetical protein